jgi:hypothetical protein
LTTEVNVVVPFEQDGQVLFLDYSEANILAFKQLDSPVHVVTSSLTNTFLHLRLFMFGAPTCVVFSKKFHAPKNPPTPFFLFFSVQCVFEIHKP